MSRPKIDRKYFQIAAALLAAIALLRLTFLLVYGGSSSTENSRVLQHHVATKILAKLEGREGERIRIHFPEVPLNLDFDYGSGSLVADLNLKMAKKPSQLRFQVLRKGLVVAQSETLTLENQTSQDFGTVQVRKPR